MGRGCARLNVELSSLWLSPNQESSGPGTADERNGDCPKSLEWLFSSSLTGVSVFPNRGKGDYFRLGHGTDVHVRKPQMVEGLRGKKIVHVAVGALHCLAVTDTGQVRTDLHRRIAKKGTQFSRSQLLPWQRSRGVNVFALL